MQTRSLLLSMVAPAPPPSDPGKIGWGRTTKPRRPGKLTPQNPGRTKSGRPANKPPGANLLLLLDLFICQSCSSFTLDATLRYTQDTCATLHTTAPFRNAILENRAHSQALDSVGLQHAKYSCSFCLSITCSSYPRWHSHKMNYQNTDKHVPELL